MKKPRFVSAILFGVLFVAQILSLQYVLMAGSLANVQLIFVFELAMILVFAAGCIVNLRATASLAQENKRAVAGAAILYLLFAGITCNMQMQMGSMSLSMFNEAWASTLTAGIVLCVIRLILFLGAVCFMLMEPKVTEVSIEFDESVKADDLLGESATDEINTVLDEKE